jgi:hypothetical protein
MAPLVQMAKTNAITALNEKIAATVAEELPDLHAEALEEDAAWNAAHRTPEVTPAAVPTAAPVQQGIDWNAAPEPETDPAVQAAPVRRFLGGAPARPNDTVALEGFRSAVRQLRRTRTADEVCQFLADELETIEVEAAKKRQQIANA